MYPLLSLKKFGGVIVIADSIALTNIFHLAFQIPAQLCNICLMAECTVFGMSPCAELAADT